MSLHWTLIGGFLISEVCFGFFLTIPFISNKRWSTVFKSNLFNKLVEWSSFVFNLMTVVLLVLFVDSIREVKRYSAAEVTEINLKENLNTKEHVMMIMFRAQRNMYLTGFSLFLLVLLRRLVSLIMTSAQLEAQNEAAMKQAESATRTAQSLLDAEGSPSDGGDKKSKSEELAKQVEQLKDKLKEAEKAETEAKDKVESMKSQCLDIQAEYEEAVAEVEKLEKLNRIANIGEEDKKDL